MHVIVASRLAPPCAELWVVGAMGSLDYSVLLKAMLPDLPGLLNQQGPSSVPQAGRFLDSSFNRLAGCNEICH